jgi:hypothetical protein
MNCYLHPEIAAVAVCANCGKALCRECAKNYKGKTCIHCARQEGNKTAFQYIIYIAMYAVLYFIGYKLDFMATKADGSHPFFSGYCLMATVSGWQFINRIIRINLFGTIQVWLIYWLLKLSLSAVVGFFTAPFTLLWNLYKIVVSFRAK